MFRERYTIFRRGFADVIHRRFSEFEKRERENAVKKERELSVESGEKTIGDRQETIALNKMPLLTCTSAIFLSDSVCARSVRVACERQTNRNNKSQ